MHIAYTPEIADNTILLNEEESKHCIQVLRMKEQDTMIAVDGKGGYYLTEIEDAHPKRCRLKIVKAEQGYGKTDYQLVIACAPTKNLDRYEWFLEKATEVGIHAILPISCMHSERTVLKTERLNKVLIAAMKQSIKAYLPLLDELERFKVVLEKLKNFEGQKFIAHCHPSKKQALKELYLPGKNVVILIGPEGDFSTEEVALAMENNFVPVSLSESRLRTETAALVACCTIQLLNGK